MRVEKNVQEMEKSKLQQCGEDQTQETERMGEGVGNRGENQLLQSGVQHKEKIVSQGDLVEGMMNAFVRVGRFPHKWKLNWGGWNKSRKGGVTH